MFAFSQVGFLTYCYFDQYHLRIDIFAYLSQWGRCPKTRSGGIDVKGFLDVE